MVVRRDIKRNGAVAAPICCFLGSSVTYGSATGGVSFAEEVGRLLGCPVIKEAVSGTTLADIGPSSYVARLKRLDKNLLLGHLVVQLSTNDVTQALPRGNISQSFRLEEFDPSTTLGAMEYIVAYAKRTWNCGITFYTNPHFESAAYADLVEDLFALEKKWGIGVIDFYNYRDMPSLGAELSAYMSDPIHPNTRGYEWMAAVFAERLSGKRSPR